MTHRVHQAREPRAHTAYRIMQQVFSYGRHARQSEREIDRAIRAAYPWGERRGWAYQAWLRARREFYEEHGLPIKERQRIAAAVEASGT